MSEEMARWPEERKPLSKISKLLLWFNLAFLIGALVIYFQIRTLNQPPDDFPVDQPILIESGTGIKTIADRLADEGVVKSGFLLYYTLVLFNEPSEIKASTYVFDEPITTFAVAKRLSEGDFDSNLIRFTHIEGERALQVAKRASEVLPEFNEVNFIEKAIPLEGRLFPDTYFVPNDFTEDDLLELMTKTFSEKTADLQSAIETHPLSEEEIIILASIIEREANDKESMELVSSVLQNRLEINMALQADASIEYILDKPLAELTPADLDIVSPYNTYLNVGLPPTPIGNPGLDSIMAVLEPADSDYFYYLTDTEGEFHYAKTYREHLINIERYLK